MKIKGLDDEDFVNYKKPSMFIGSYFCNWKCCVEQGLDISICQNNQLSKTPTIDYSIEDMYNRYIDNKITSSIVIGGLEPMEQFKDMMDFIRFFRDNGCNDDIIIYTGYYEHEIQGMINMIKNNFKNIIFKFGRYMPNLESRFDEVLGVTLASSNQYGKRIC